MEQLAQIMEVVGKLNPHNQVRALTMLKAMETAQRTVGVQVNEEGHLSLPNLNWVYARSREYAFCFEPGHQHCGWMMCQGVDVWTSVRELTVEELIKLQASSACAAVQHVIAAQLSKLQRRISEQRNHG